VWIGRTADVASSLAEGRVSGKSVLEHCSLRRGHADFRAWVIPGGVLNGRGKVNERWWGVVVEELVPGAAAVIIDTTAQRKKTRGSELPVT